MSKYEKNACKNFASVITDSLNRSKTSRDEVGLHNWSQH